MRSPSNHWFVAVDAKRGNGSREQPFHDLWLALRLAEPGHCIHIGAGTYFGRYDRSSWLIDCPNLTLLGGYTSDFSARTPWETPSVLAAFHGYEATREFNFMTGRGDHSGLVLDGLFFDAAGSNSYGNEPTDGIRRFPIMSGPLASFNAGDVTIRNCVFANSATGGVELSGDGSRFENNLVLNIIGPSMLTLRRTATNTGSSVTVAHNTFCFAHDMGDLPLGTGADRAVGVRLERSAVVQDNLFLSCGNAAIAVSDQDRISIDRNLFYVTPRALVTSHAQGAAGEITEANFDELEDLGLKSASANIIQSPGMTGFNTAWLDSYSRHLLANYARPPFEAANALRTAAGLSPLTPANLTSPIEKGDLAPRLDPMDAIAIRTSSTQGFHPIVLESVSSTQPPAAGPSYIAVPWSVLEIPDPALANSRIELRAGLGLDQNTTLLSDTDASRHMGIRIFRPLSDSTPLFVLARRYTLAARQFEEAIKYNRGLDVESHYLIRGIYRTDTLLGVRQKATIIVESLVLAPLLATDFPLRPIGRDWFVRAGATGGDGSRERPFRDPFQALERAEGGDAIHVTTGEYFGKLHSGKWTLSVRNLTMLGGYNGDFTQRDPWHNPTRFLLTPEERSKGLPDGKILGSSENSEGLILDGFIFDGATYNGYTPNGSLDPRQAPTGPLLSLGGGRAPIVVRNCLFLNAGEAAVQINCPFGTFENNLILNTSGRAVTINAGGTGPWNISKNMFLFACDPTDRAGTGKSIAGTLLLLTGRAVATLDSNIFAFADNFAVRCGFPQSNVVFENNVFAANLFCYLTDEQYLWANDINWDRRAVADSAFASFRNNTLDLPQLPIDCAFSNTVMSRLFTLTDHFSADQWKAIAAKIGSTAEPKPVAASAAAPITPAPPPPASSSSLTSLLASLSAARDASKREEPSQLPDASAPIYCPVFDWKEAIALASPTEITVSFSTTESEKTKEYKPISACEIDGDYALLDNQLVQLEVTGFRDSSHNPSLYPPGTTQRDYVALSASINGTSSRTSLSIVIKLDSVAFKLFGRIRANDILRIRGTAHMAGGPYALAIVVDTAELAQD